MSQVERGTFGGNLGSVVIIPALFVAQLLFGIEFDQSRVKKMSSEDGC